MDFSATQGLHRKKGCKTNLIQQQIIREICTFFVRFLVFKHHTSKIGIEGGWEWGQNIL